MTNNLSISMENLEISERMSRAVIENAQDSIITISEDFLVLSFNQSAEKFIGYLSDNIIGKNINLILKSEYANKSIDFIKEVLNRKNSSSGSGCEEKVIIQNGKQVDCFIQISFSIIKEKIIFTIIIRDLTEDIKYKAEIQKRSNEAEQQSWLKSNTSKLLEMMQGITDIYEVTSRILTEFSHQLNIGIGAFYINEQFLDKNRENILKLKSSYAYDNSGNKSKPFKFGEGLVGQCAAERKIIKFSDIPEDYIKINSGLGNKKTRGITPIANIIRK